MGVEFKLKRVVNEDGEIITYDNDGNVFCQCSKIRRGEILGDPPKIHFHCDDCHFSWTRPKLMHCAKCHESFSADSVFSAHFSREVYKGEWRYYCDSERAEFGRRFVFDTEQRIWRHPDRIDYLGIIIPTGDNVKKFVVDW